MNNDTAVLLRGNHLLRLIGADNIKNIWREFVARSLRHGDLYELRGDAISYMCETLQAEAVGKVNMAYDFACHRNGGEDFIFVMRADDFRLANKWTRREEVIPAQHWVYDIFGGVFRGDSGDDILGNDSGESLGNPEMGTFGFAYKILANGPLMATFKYEICDALVTELARQRQKSVVYDQEFATLIWKDVMIGIATLVYDFVVQFDFDLLNYPNSLADCCPWKGMSEEVLVERTSRFRGEDVRMRTPPPFVHKGVPKIVIVPGMIKEAVMRRGKTPLTIFPFGRLGESEWATSLGRTKHEEVELARDHYRQCAIMVPYYEEMDGGYLIESDSEAEYHADASTSSLGSLNLDSGWSGDESGNESDTPVN